jgi:outer membrane protein OmpA-like peptidoglycan-associated protein
VTRTASRLLVGGALLLAAGGASAQVAVNPAAINQLQPEHAQHSPPRRAASRTARRPVHHPPSAHPAAPTSPTAAKPAVPTAAAPRVPAAPPSAAVIPPPAVVVPTAAPPPLPPIPVAADAPGAAAPVQGGLRITFGKDRSDLSPATVAAIEAIAGQVKDKPGPLDITAYAAGVPDDPSTPRRLSLARALAVRTVLLHQGIESPRIYVRAMGTSATPGDPAATPPAPADRVDLIQEHAAPVPSTAQAAGQ